MDELFVRARSRGGRPARSRRARAIASRICGHVGVEDVVNVANQQEVHILGRSLGERFYEAQQVLVRAQAADIKQEPAVRRDANPGQDGVGLGIAGSRREDPDRGLR